MLTRLSAGKKWASHFWGYCTLPAAVWWNSEGVHIHRHGLWQSALHHSSLKEKSSWSQWPKSIHYLLLMKILKYTDCSKDVLQICKIYWVKRSLDLGSRVVSFFYCVLQANISRLSIRYAKFGSFSYFCFGNQQRWILIPSRKPACFSLPLAPGLSGLRFDRVFLPWRRWISVF